MPEALAFGGLGTSELILIAAVVLLLFGAKKIPELMRSVGSGIRQFKKGLDDVAHEEPEKEEPWTNRKSA